MFQTSSWVVRRACCHISTFACSGPGDVITQGCSHLCSLHAFWKSLELRITSRNFAGFCVTHHAWELNVIAIGASVLQ